MCAPARSTPTTPSSGCDACRSSRWATPWSTITGRCARACPRPCTASGKTVEQCVAIVGELLANGAGPGAADAGRCCPTRRRARRHSGQASRRSAAVLVAPPGRPLEPLACWSSAPAPATCPVVDECVLTLRAYGFEPDRLTDVGVAGLHRLLAHIDRITAADAVVVVAGMEGALASVIGGLTARPGRRRAHQRRLRRRPRRRHRAAGDARVVRQRRHRGGHRQRVRRSVRRSPG